MQDYSFSWDENKQVANIKKHGISFDETASVFDDITRFNFTVQEVKLCMIILTMTKI